MATPFKIAVPDAAVARLKDKLALATYAVDTNFTDDWASGTPATDIKRLVARWKDGFDWRAQEAKLNQIPHFTTKVPVNGFDELRIHLVHKKSSRKNAIPLLFIHGWPGSFCEVLKMVPLLTEPSDLTAQAFHVVAPSLPNFAFSDGVRRKGFGLPQYAESMHKTMLNLGYNRYVTQGGDWGSSISRCIAAQYPKNCLAGHINFVLIVKPPSWNHFPLVYAQQSMRPWTEAEKAGLERTNRFNTEGRGYYMEQATRPNTIAAALADSPVALLAWIYEKLHDWADDYPWEDDEVLTWVSIYAFSTAGPAASVRIYYESTHAERERTSKALGFVPHVKLGASIFPKDLFVPPVKWANVLGPLVFARVHQDGGHFAAYEKPEELVQDLQDMFGNQGGARDVLRAL